MWYYSRSILFLVLFKSLILCSHYTSFFCYCDEIRCNVSLTELNDLIVKNILQPVKGREKDIVNNIFMYYDILDDAKNLVDDGRPEGQRIVDEIGPEGPEWVKVKFDEHLLRCTYNWVSRDLSHFVGSRDATIELWQSLSQNKTLIESE